MPRFWLNVALFFSFCLLETVPFTGLVIHELLGVALPALVIAHLLFSWPWISTFPRKPRTRVNYALNLALFASVTIAVASGVQIWQHPDPAWHSIHDTASNAVVVLAGLHLGMNFRVPSRRPSVA